MKIRDNTNQFDSLYHLALRWALATEADYPFAPDFLQDANLALNKVSSVIKRNDNTWEWSDHNNSTQDIATTPLVSGKSFYPVNPTHLKILKVRITGKDGVLKTLPTGNRRTQDKILNETGEPKSYDPLGGGIVLVPTPDYGGTVEMQFQQPSNYFEEGDTDKEPGFDSEYHEIVALISALTYTEINGTEAQATKIRNRLGQPPTKDFAGSGLWNELALAYQNRDYGQVQTLNIKRSARGANSLVL